MHSHMMIGVLVSNHFTNSVTHMFIPPSILPLTLECSFILCFIGSIYSNGILYASSDCNQATPMPLVNRTAATLNAVGNPALASVGLNSWQMTQMQYYNRSLTAVEIASLNTLMPTGPFSIALTPGPILYPLGWGPSTLPVTAPAGSTITITVLVPLSYGVPSTLFILTAPVELVSQATISFYTSSPSDSAAKTFVLTMPSDGTPSLSVNFAWAGDTNVVAPPSFVILVTTRALLDSTAIFSMDMRMPPAGFVMPAEASSTLFIAPNDVSDPPTNLVSAHATLSGGPTGWMNLSAPEKYAQGHVAPIPGNWTQHLPSLNYLQLQNIGRGWAVSFWYRAVSKTSTGNIWDLVFTSGNVGGIDNIYISVAPSYVRVSIGSGPNSNSVVTFFTIPNVRLRWMHFVVQQEPSSLVSVLLYGVAMATSTIVSQKKKKKNIA